MKLINFSRKTYSRNVSVFALAIYAALVYAQTVTHKDYFEPISKEEFKRLEVADFLPTKLEAMVSFIGLIVSLITVVGLAKLLSPSISKVVNLLGAPPSAVGIIVALLVLAPETVAAVNSAKANRLQTSFNLALGSGAASVALTIPVVSVYSILTGETLMLGLDGISIVFLFLTFLVGSFTLNSGRTTTLLGIVHLIILLSYIAISFIP